MNRTEETTAIRALIDETMQRLLLDPSINCLGPGEGAPAWDAPLIGVSSGADPLYEKLKDVIAPSHWTPAEAFARSHDEEKARQADDLSVVSWALPQTRATKDSNRRQHLFPSEAWARARLYGQDCNKLLHDRLIETLAGEGIAAVAPSFLPSWREEVCDGVPVMSSWSERHVAYISGLGTFGLCGGLITAAGKAVRLGSLVIGARLSPTPRPYSDPHEYCLFFSRGICARCAARCPVGSVSIAGRNKAACAQHLQGRTKAFVKRAYDLDGYGCGLCQTAVPCESGIPGAARKLDRRD
jgi:epoxyqueuosine reductase